MKNILVMKSLKVFKNMIFGTWPSLNSDQQQSGSNRSDHLGNS